MKAVPALRRDLGAAGRFLVAGVLNTALTGAALAGLSLVIDPRLAYAVIFAFGVALNVYLAGRFVFRSTFSARKIVIFGLTYVAIFAVGLVAVEGIRGLDAPRWATGAVIFVTAPLSFLAGRTIFRPKESS